MKTSKVCFQHRLNDAGRRIRTKLDPGDLLSMDDFFESWRNQRSIRPFGEWLRKEYPLEFNTRYANWKVRYS